MYPTRGSIFCRALSSASEPPSFSAPASRARSSSVDQRSITMSTVAVFTPRARPLMSTANAV